MTCKEKYEKTFGEKLNPHDHCPDDFGYLPPPLAPVDLCAYKKCEECWNREIPKTKTIVPARKRMSEDYVEGPGTGPVIKDSGDRTQFVTGAVRDMREGKGRCDLAPLEVIANYICDDNEDVDWVLWNLREFQKDQSTSHLYSAMNHFDSMCWKNQYTMFLEVAKHFEDGAKKYGENNWQKGIPTYCYIDSAVRHYLKWLRGDNDEPHDRAFVWNLLCCIWEVDYRENTPGTPKKEPAHNANTCVSCGAIIPEGRLQCPDCE